MTDKDILTIYARVVLARAVAAPDDPKAPVYARLLAVLDDLAAMNDITISVSATGVRIRKGRGMELPQ